MLGCKVLRLKRAEEIGVGAQEIVAVYVQHLPQACSQRTLVFSHGNAVDLGQMLPFYRCGTARLLYPRGRGN